MALRRSSVRSAPLPCPGQRFTLQKLRDSPDLRPVAVRFRSDPLVQTMNPMRGSYPTRGSHTGSQRGSTR